MELTTNYIISQILTITMYVFLASSYYAKSRKKVLILNFSATIIVSIAYLLLNAYTGLLMSVISFIRSLIFLIDENINGKRDKINKKDIIILITIFAMAIISAIYTYDGFFSLLSLFATLIYTYSVCQKKTSTYKILGIPTSLLWMSYNFYIGSVFGFFLEGIILIFSTTGYIYEVKNNNTTNWRKK